MARLGEKVLDKVNGVQDKIRTLQTSNTPHMPRLSIRQQWEAQRNNRTDVNQPPDQWLPTAVTGQHSAQDPTQPALDESSNHEASHHPVIAQPSSTNYPTQETLSDDILTQESPDWIDFDSAFNNIDAFFDAFPDLSFPTNLPEMAPLDGPAA